MNITPRAHSRTKTPKICTMLFCLSCRGAWPTTDLRPLPHWQHEFQQGPARLNETVACVQAKKATEALKELSGYALPALGLGLLLVCPMLQLCSRVALQENFPDLYLYDPTPVHKACNAGSKCQATTRRECACQALWRVSSRCTAVQKALTNRDLPEAEEGCCEARCDRRMATMACTSSPEYQG